jgi:murein DD-endopeptidase MepM/ murein hydrolase activator NlpD
MLCACAEFRGPGEFQSAGPSATEPAPTTAAADAAGPARERPGGDSAPSFDWPVEEARISRGFRAARRAHWGIDLANRKGTKILASEKGYVIYRGREFHGYGNLIVIEHDSQWATLYAHLDKFLVKEGEFVQRGQAIGLMGRTGHASGSHLHFEIRQNRVPVNPLSFLPQGF